MIRRTGPKLVSLLAAPILILTACGGNDDDKDASAVESSDPTASSDEPEEETSPSSPDPADLKIAEAALLTLADFPVGWEAVPAEDDDQDVEGQEEIAECIGVDYDELYDGSNAEAQSPAFTNEDDEDVSVEVTVDATEEEMAEAFAIAASPEFRECVTEAAGDAMEEAFADAEDEGAEVGDITLNEVSLGSYGDETVAFRLTIPIEMEGFNLEATGDFAVVRVGRGMTFLDSTRFSFGSMTTEDFVGYVELAAQRLESALAGAP